VNTAFDVHAISMDPAAAKRLKPSGDPCPAVVVARAASLLPSGSAGLIDTADVIALIDGDWGNTLLLVLREGETEKVADGSKAAAKGDNFFIKEVERSAPHLTELARQTMSKIRAAGVDGELIKTSGGKWKNDPLNTFTIKVQPRAGNLQFTLYGNPESYDAGEFLLRDQNSYSRGWIKHVDDATKMAALAQQSHARRRR
jgi:hypothetical protein